MNLNRSKEPRPEITEGIKSRKVDYSFHSATQSICNVCKQLINAQRIIRDEKVYMRKFCPEHGHQEAIISSHAGWFLNSYGNQTPDYRPKEFATEMKHGCPYDCGLCPDHQHHTCKAVVELTDACDLKCPVCLVGEKGKTFLTLDECNELFDNYIKLEGGYAEALTISGGEPTLHPKILDVLKAAVDKNVNCVHLNTHGIKLANDESFVEKLANINGNLYVNLQFDGFDDKIWQSTRGVNLLDVKIKCIELLQKYNIKTQLTMTAIKGVNDHQIGELMRLCLDTDCVHAFNIQPIVYTGVAADQVNFDPYTRLTIPDIIIALEKQTNGLVQMSDWAGLCTSMCEASCYVHLDSSGNISSMKRMLDKAQYDGIVANRPDATWEFKNISNAKSSANASCCASDCCGPAPQIENTGNTKKIMKIGIHAFMDSYTFDIERVMQCCIHCLTTDGRIMPWCAYNHFYRENDPRYFDKFTKSGGYSITPTKLNK